MYFLLSRELIFVAQMGSSVSSPLYVLTLLLCFCVSLGRFYAFEKAHRLDQNSVGRGVRQFKTALLQRLEKVRHISLC